MHCKRGRCLSIIAILKGFFYFRVGGFDDFDFIFKAGFDDVDSDGFGGAESFDSGGFGFAELFDSGGFGEGVGVGHRVLGESPRN